MSKHDKVIKFIKELVEKYDKGGYIFRGTTERYSEKEGYGGVFDGISSTLYRWAMAEKKDEKIPDQQKLFRKALGNRSSFFVADIESVIVLKISHLFPSNTKNHEVLTELQHFGGNTNMIDFTRNIYIALLFACQGKYGEDGELIALSKGKLTQIDEVDYSKIPEELEIIRPAGAQSSRQRVHFQSSVFVRPKRGYINTNPELCDITPIPADLKKPILEYLSMAHNLTAETVYNDLHGFIKNEKNGKAESLYFNLGRAHLRNGQHKKAILYFGKCIRCNPNTPNVAGAYSNRGMCYSALGGDKSDAGNSKKASLFYKCAIRDLNKAISLMPDSYITYNNRGNTYYRMDKLDLAFEDYNQAIFFKPDFSEAYCNRGNIYSDRGKHESKIGDSKKARFTYARANADYSKAIELEEGLKRGAAEAYYLRGKLRKETGNKEGAKADFDKARELGFIGPEGEEE